VAVLVVTDKAKDVLRRLVQERLDAFQGVAVAISGDRSLEMTEMLMASSDHHEELDALEELKRELKL
jgi:hypothetical protein